MSSRLIGEQGDSQGPSVLHSGQPESVTFQLVKIQHLGKHAHGYFSIIIVICFVSFALHRSFRSFVSVLQLFSLFRVLRFLVRSAPE